MLGFIIRLGARVPFLLIAGRLYGTSSYGEYVLLTTIVETAALFASFGLKRAIFSFIDSRPGEISAVIRHAVVVVLGISTVLMVVMHLFAHEMLAVLSASEVSEKLGLLLWAIPMIAVSDVYLSAMLSRRIVRYEIVIRSVVEPVTLTGLSLLFFILGYAEDGLIWAFLCAFGIAAFVSACICGRTFGAKVFYGAIDPRFLARMINGSVYTCLHDLARVLLTRLDIFAVGFFFSTAAVGTYGMAQQFLTAVEKVALSFYPILMPVVSNAVSLGDRRRITQQLTSTGVRMVILQMPIIMIFFVFGESLLALMGEDFSTAWSTLLILSVGCWINAAAQLVEVPLTYLRPHINLISALCAVIVYLSIIHPLQTALGVNGIALTSVISASFANALLVTVFIGKQISPSPKHTKALCQREMT